ncbi:MAG: uL22 family ribosomal protein [Patescibacteria group bacterium]
MESRHLLKNVNVSIRKVRMFLPNVKKMQPAEAVERLGFLPHSAAKVLAAGIKTAISNAQSTLKVPANMLEFRSLKADQGMVLKRFRAGSRGTALPINRRMTHITIILGVKGAAKEVEKAVKEVKKTEKVEEPKEEKKEVKEAKKTRSSKKAKTEKETVEAVK